MNYNYKIPIIPQNLDKHETIVQISDAFQYLSDVTDTLFAHINKKIESDQQKVGSLSDRINTVSAKINQLKGSKTATQVFSSSKYPASDVSKDYVSIFSDCPSVEYKSHSVKHKNFHLTHEPLEKLQLYHVNVPQEIQRKNLKGLPRERVNFVNDLHFTTPERNSYMQYEKNDALKNPQNKDDISKIDEAPHSISDKANLTKTVAQEYTYAPQIGEVPALEVPLDLPDLPGVADNLHYENDLGPAIAPSAFIESINNLPTIESIEIETPIAIPSSLSIPPPPPAPVSDMHTSTIGLPIPTADLPKPPAEPSPKLPQLVHLPEPPVEAKHHSTLSQDIKNNPQLTITTAKEEETTPKKVPPTVDLRSSLMEEIRNAGGSGKAKLKSVSSNEEKEKESKAVPAGDLMADLHKKLFMRRKGISGNKKTDENSIDPNSTLGKISAMIPSPEKVNLESASNDEDWD